MAEDAAPVIFDGHRHSCRVEGDRHMGGPRTSRILEQLVQDVREAGIEEIPGLFQELRIDADAEGVGVCRLDRLCHG